MYTQEISLVVAEYSIIETLQLCKSEVGQTRHGRGGRRRGKDRGRGIFQGVEAVERQCLNLME